MAIKKILAVVGATGAQGGGLAYAILNDPSQEFAVRAITRKPDSDKAKALASAGAEIVVADLEDLKSLEKAFAGAYGAFCVTNYWELYSVEKEMAQAKNLATAAKNGGIKHAIWSTLEDTRKWVPLSDTRMPTLAGNYKCPHFDSKGSSNAYFTEAGVPTTFLLTSFYWDNFIYFGLGPKRGEDGVLYFTIPMGDKKLPGIAAEDIGKCALSIFKRGDQFIGKTVGIAGEHLTMPQMTAALTKALGEKAVYNNVSPDTFRSFGFPGADDLGNMFQFKADFEDYYCGARDLNFSRSLNPSLQTFDQWLSKNASLIPVK